MPNTMSERPRYTGLAHFSAAIVCDEVMQISHMRPWFGLSHNLADIGIFATLTEGPTLRGLDAELSVMPLGGEETL